MPNKFSGFEKVFFSLHLRLGAQNLIAATG